MALIYFSEAMQLSTEQKRISMPHDSGLVRSKHCGEGMAVLCKVTKAQVPEAVLSRYHRCLKARTLAEGTGKKPGQF